ncbi:hypothetical protein [Flavobacterium cheniae]|uniref:Uncharacterized protein n=1 Tax=Flavobacterium cheniae TaxID=295428 RepID=A0A562KJ95_9FLAO|nr:hypothetical protein [Flavobacterium cheniae]TDR25837.1 hypothetical protein C8D80_0626 [Flavobacterium cheniae]TWH95446.1 hypothetical protein IP97_01122 [Flavobacterium cheniae]
MSWIERIFGNKNKSEINKEISIHKNEIIQSNFNHIDESVIPKIEYIQLTTNWNADPVLPKIELKIDQTELIMDIYLNYYVFDNFKKGDKVKIRFKNCTLYSLNTCNDEGYYYGQYRTNPSELPWGEFYEIISGLDKNMPNPIEIIVNNNSEKKHFIFFFKDETFECLASDHELEFYNEKLNILHQNKIYRIFLDDKEIGISELEKADAPMGVVTGKLNFIDTKFGYGFLKEYCENNQIELAYDYPEVKMISTMSIPKLKITNNVGIEIKGVGNQISGMDNEEYQIEIFGIPYPFYEEEFPIHVAEYKSIFDKK